MSVSAGPSRRRGRAAGSEATAPAASPDLARRWHPLGMDSLVTDRHPPSRSSRSHIRIAPRHRARLAPTPARPLRSPVLGRSRRPGPRGSWALSGRRPGPGTRWEAPRGRPGRVDGGLHASGGRRGRHGLGGGAGALRESGVPVRVRGAGGSLTWGPRLPGAPGAGGGAGESAPGADAEEKETLIARTTQPDSAPGTASAGGGEAGFRGARGGIGGGAWRAGPGRGPVEPSGTRGPN